MRTLLFIFSIFACGMLTAYVDWEEFLNETVSFKNVEPNHVVKKDNIL